MSTILSQSKRTTWLAGAAVAIGLLAALTVPAAADSAAAGGRAVQVQLRAFPDANVPSGHDPYVGFELTGARPGHKYRITQEAGPKATGTCSSALTTEWVRADVAGTVKFPLEPVKTGKYYDWDGFEPCHGGYFLKVERRASSTLQPTVRRVLLAYPSFKTRYLSLRP